MTDNKEPFNPKIGDVVYWKRYDDSVIEVTIIAQLPDSKDMFNVRHKEAAVFPRAYLKNLFRTPQEAFDFKE